MVAVDCACARDGARAVAVRASALRCSGDRREALLMLGLDDWLINLTTDPLTFVALISILLGLRHATDPDHLTALLTLRLDRTQRHSVRLGLAWGIGHGTTMILIGVPLILAIAVVPEVVQQGLEFAVGAVIIGLAVRAIARGLRTHTHEHGHHDGTHHAHEHGHLVGEHAHRTPRQAAAIGLLHGAGGSAGMVALVLGRLDDPTLAIAALVVIACFTAVSMAACSWLMCHGLDQVITRVGRRGVAVAGGSLALLFGAWYCAAAVQIAPYPF
jgi:hypothetical protein